MPAQLSKARYAETAVQDRTVADYRNQWGYPLGLNRGSKVASAFILLLCVAGIVAGLVLIAVLS